MVNDWKKLEKDIGHWLSAFASQTIVYRDSHQAIFGFHPNWFRIYTPDFRKYQSRKNLGEFYAEKAQREAPIEYVLLDYQMSKKSSKTAFREITRKIKTIIMREFRASQPLG